MTEAAAAHSLHAPIAGPGAWLAGGMADPATFRVSVAGHRRALDAVLAEIRRQGLPLGEIDPASLPMAGLRDLAEELLPTLREGRGFCVITDLAPGTTADEAAILYWLLGAAMGEPLPQNRDGDRLGAVEDRSWIEAQPRGYRTRETMTFHTDSADVVGLMCARQAKAGGESRIASALGIHNIILAERPHLLEPLYRGFFYDRAGEGTPTANRVPVFSERDGLVSCWIYAPLAEAGMAGAGLGLSSLEREALDFFEEVARRDTVHLDFLLAPGEILLLNNLTTLHARKQFEDHDDPAAKRKLWRLWLRIPGFRPIDPAMRQI